MNNRYTLTQLLPPIQKCPSVKYAIQRLEPKFCNECNGKGKVVVSDQRSEDEYGSYCHVDDSSYYIKECIFCGGTGYFFVPKTLPAIKAVEYICGLEEEVFYLDGKFLILEQEAVRLLEERVELAKKELAEAKKKYHV